MDNPPLLTETPNVFYIAIAIISFCGIVVLVLIRRRFAKWGVVYVFSILIFMGSIGILAEGPDEYEIVSMTGQVMTKRAEYYSQYPGSGGRAHIVIVDGEEFGVREEVFDWLETGETVIVKYQVARGDKRVIRVEKLNYSPTGVDD